MNEVLACTATVLSLYVSCSCSVVFGWIWNSPPSLPAKRAAGCMGQWSAQLTSLLLVWSQASPGVQMHSSALDIFTVHSILLDIIFTIALGLVCIALFQINDHTIYIFARLLQFFWFSAKIAAVPKLLARTCCRAFYGGSGLPTPCWACSQSCTPPHWWHPCSSDNQGAPRVPQHLWVSHPIASYVLGGGGLSALQCRCAVVWQGGAKAIKEDARSQASKWWCGHMLLTSCDHPGKSLGSCRVRGWVIPRSSRKCQWLMKPGNKWY